MAYELTALGKTLATKHTDMTNPEDAIICYLYENPGPVEIDEIVGELRSDESTVDKILMHLSSTDNPHQGALVKET